MVVPDYIHSLIQGIRYAPALFFRPSTHRVTHRVKSYKDVGALVDEYDMNINDVDCTLTEYHGKKRIDEFERTFLHAGPKGEIASNSKLERFFELAQIFGDVMPVNKLVKIDNKIILLHYDKGLQTWEYNPETHKLTDLTATYVKDGMLTCRIARQYKKPHPMTINAIIALRVQQGKVKEKPRVVVCGDAYMTDMAAANFAIRKAPDLATIDTIKVEPHQPHSQPLLVYAWRSTIDHYVGSTLSRINKRI